MSKKEEPQVPMTEQQIKKMILRKMSQEWSGYLAWTKEAIHYPTLKLKDRCLLPEYAKIAPVENKMLMWVYPLIMLAQTWTELEEKLELVFGNIDPKDWPTTEINTSAVVKIKTAVGNIFFATAILLRETNIKLSDEHLTIIMDGQVGREEFTISTLFDIYGKSFREMVGYTNAIYEDELKAILTKILAYAMGIAKIVDADVTAKDIISISMNERQNKIAEEERARAAALNKNLGLTPGTEPELPLNTGADPF